MIAAGRDAILRELTHPERDDIGRYKAEEVAAAVCQSMAAVSGEQRVGESQNAGAELVEAF